MSLKKSTVVVSTIHNDVPRVEYETDWDGDLADWIEIGGEIGGLIHDGNKVEVTITPKED